jgi:GDP/UDP-N,N'-diacetylbacillosamine 2-epimerase (hydrolysing)
MSSSKRKPNIFIVTGSRADYGLLKPLIKKIFLNKLVFNLKLVVTGSHLNKKFGYTISEILEDKFKIYKKISLKINSDSPKGIGNSISHAIKEFSSLFSQSKPDLLIVLGDRYEIFSVVLSAHIFGIPIIHIQGGEVTESAIDDALRHSISKMADIHFVANLVYKNRLIQLGENPKNIFITGALGVDNIASTVFFSKKEIENKLKIKLKKKNLLVTYHPITLAKNNFENNKDINILLQSLKKFRDIQLIFTIPNADTYNKVIKKKILNFSKLNKNCHIFNSLGIKMYLSLLRYVDGVVGNSSSGIIEAPYLKKGTLNIGDRQTGRCKPSSIIDVRMNIHEIIYGIKKLYSKNFFLNLKNIKVLDLPYGKKGASSKMLKIINSLDIKKIKKNKKFFDLKLDFKRFYKIKLLN